MNRWLSTYRSFVCSPSFVRAIGKVGKSYVKTETVGLRYVRYIYKQYKTCLNIQVKNGFGDVLLWIRQTRNHSSIGALKHWAINLSLGMILSYIIILLWYIIKNHSIIIYNNIHHSSKCIRKIANFPPKGPLLVTCSTSLRSVRYMQRSWQEV